jgi:hypothetical protein
MSGTKFVDFIEGIRCGGRNVATIARRRILQRSGIGRWPLKELCDTFASLLLTAGVQL